MDANGFWKDDNCSRALPFVCVVINGNESCLLFFFHISDASSRFRAAYIFLYTSTLIKILNIFFVHVYSHTHRGCLKACSSVNNMADGKVRTDRPSR